MATRPAQKRDKYFSIRVDEGTRKGLESAAKANSRTFTREIAARLEDSLSLEETLRGRFGDPATRAFSQHVAWAASMAGHYKKMSWCTDQWTYQFFKGAVEVILSKLAPGGAVEPPSAAGAAQPTQEDFADPERLGRLFGSQILSATRMFGSIKEANSTIEGADRFRELYRDLRFDVENGRSSTRRSRK
jgi:hypothetical protein